MAGHHLLIMPKLIGAFKSEPILWHNPPFIGFPILLNDYNRPALLRVAQVAGVSEGSALKTLNKLLELRITLSAFLPPTPDWPYRDELLFLDEAEVAQILVDMANGLL